MKNQEVAKMSLGSMLGIGITVAVVGIAMGFSLGVIADLQDDMGVDNCATYPPASGYTTYSETYQQCTNGSNYLRPQTAEFNATEYTQDGLSKLPEKLPLIVTVVVAAIIIGLLIRSFAFK